MSATPSAPPRQPAFRAEEAYARELDAADPLRGWREQFCLPTALHPEVVYLTGNSLGLMPKAAREAVTRELDDWAALAVEGHFEALRPWFPYHEFLRDAAARLVGGLPHEVVVMNSLTVNLHLMMRSFYRPTDERFQIAIEDAAFPSDSYAVQSHAASRGLDPAKAVVRLTPREGEHLLRTEDVIEFLRVRGRGGAVALLLLGAVNYRTGQVMDMERITAAARAEGITVGWDLAHAAGNIPLKLHEWGADFACWCSYKYLNSGPGAVAGCFVHERHARNTDWQGSGGLPRYAGWWGNDPKTRFAMGPEFHAVPSADAWQISNPPILALAAVKASLDIFDRVGMSALRAKSVRLTGYLEFLLGAFPAGTLEILTPRDPAERGCQLSIAVQRPAKDGATGRALLKTLRGRGVICDFREPNVIRAAPVPLYNSFEDVWRFAAILRDVLGA